MAGRTRYIAGIVELDSGDTIVVLAHKAYACRDSRLWLRIVERH